MSDSSIRRRAAVACVCVLAGALGGPVAGQDGDAADGDAPSVARSCLNRPFIKRTRILNDRNIVFVTRDDAIYKQSIAAAMPESQARQLGELSDRQRPPVRGR